MDVSPPAGPPAWLSKTIMLGRIASVRSETRPQTGEGPVSAVSKLRVLIAEDQPHMRGTLRRALASSPDFEVVGEASDGQTGLALALRLRPDVALVDLQMPGLDGIAMIRALRAAGCDSRTLVLTGHGDRRSVAGALEAGADGYVLKGCPTEELRAAIRGVGRGASVLSPAVTRGVVEDYTKMLEEKRNRDVAVIRTLAAAVEARDRCTGDHIKNVAELSLALWHSMGGDDSEHDLQYGFLLHDVGKIAIPDAILLKAGPLDPEEFAIMRRHSEIGAELIQPLGFRPIVVEIIRCHHERWDGNGYPEGLEGEAVPLQARLFSIVDAFDAMTTDRPYRRAMAAAAALEEIDRASGTQFDPTCVDAFCRLAEDLGLV